jgi:acyl carrier protein
MNRSEMRNLIIATLARHLNVSEQRVTESADLCEDLGADSLDVVELVLEFEEMFKVEIPDDDVEQITTVGNTIDYLLGKVNNSMIEENEVEQPPRDPENEVEEPELPVEDNDDDQPEEAEEEE